MTRSNRRSYLFNYWASGFITCGGLNNLFEGRWLWSLILFALAVLNYIIGRRDYQKRVKTFDSFADLRSYLDEETV